MRHKYNVSAADDRTCDGITFDSKKEMKYYQKLKLEKEAGEVLDIWRQIPFRFPDDKYVCDFVVFRKDGTIDVVDVKGYRTPEYKRKVKLMKKYYPLFPIKEV